MLLRHRIRKFVPIRATMPTLAASGLLVALLARAAIAADIQIVVDQAKLIKLPERVATVPSLTGTGAKSEEASTVGASATNPDANKEQHD